jgi:hypothetical protein
MIHRKHKTKYKISSLILTLVMALGVFAVPAIRLFSNTAYAAVNEIITLPNGNFNTNREQSYLDSSPSGWTKLKSNAVGTHGIINTAGSKFNKSSYRLVENPQTLIVDENDTKVLMLNARKSEDSELSNDKTQSSQGYKSTQVNLIGYSYYQISVLAKSEIGAFGSIYLNGTTAKPQNNTDDISAQSKFEAFQTSKNWTEFIFFIETSAKDESVSLELWLGDKYNRTSPYAVFYDNVRVTKHSQISYNKQIEINSNSQNTKVITLKKHYLTSVENANFEINDITAKNLNGDRHWETVSDYELGFPLNSISKIVDSSKDKVLNDGTTVYNQLGANNIAGNNALWLAGKDVISKEFGYKSTSLPIAKFNYYKINITAKVDTDTTAKILLVENNDIIDFLKNAGIDENEISYTPKTESFTITSNPSNSLMNDYGNYTFFVKASSIYSTSLHLKLLITSQSEEDNTLSGSVLFDDITVESISSSAFETASNSNQLKKVDFETTNNELSVANGTFNLVNVDIENNSFPLKAKEWEAKQEDEQKSVNGIVNLQTEHYNANQANYGMFVNPGNPSGANTDTQSNNVFMLWNKELTYQSATSNNITVSKNGYYTLSFDFKTTEAASNFNISILNQDNVKIYKIGNVTTAFESSGSSTNVWLKFKINIKTGESTTGLKVVFALGDENAKSIGHVFIDNVAINSKEITEEVFLEKLNNPSMFEKTFDMSNLLLNAPFKETDGTYTITAFDQAYKIGYSENAIAGVLDGISLNDQDIANSEENTSNNKFIYYIETFGKSNYGLTSRETVSLEQEKIYKFSIWVNTRLENPNDDKLEYGATFSIDGVNARLGNIKTDGEWKEVVIIINTTQASDVKLALSLLSPNHAASGIAFFENFTLSQLTQDEYQEFATEFKEETNPMLLVVGSTDPVEETPEEEEDKERDFNWLIIPSLLTGIALVLAILGTVLKKVNFKKYNRKKKSDYDRKQTLYKDVVRKQATEERDKQLIEVNKQIKTLDEEIANLEAENQERLQNQRKEKGKQIDKEVEKQFKQYASKRTKLDKQKDVLVQKATYYNTAEYLLTLQDKIIQQQIKNLK